MKTVVISDIHNHVENAQYVLDTEKADKYVILGDVFDDFDDTPEIVKGVAAWLAKTIERDDVIVLFGNHDMPYRFMNPHVWCPGFSKEKYIAINSEMSFDHWDKIRFYHYDQGWYISHAGLAEPIFSHPIHGITREWLDYEVDKGITHLLAGENARFVKMGSRMGLQTVGGLTWQDWNSEFRCVTGINQIVGHTPHSCVRVKYQLKANRGKEYGVYNQHCVLSMFDQDPLDQYDSLNFCIDTGSRHYAVIQDGQIQIKQNKKRHESVS